MPLNEVHDQVVWSSKVFVEDIFENLSDKSFLWHCNVKLEFILFDDLRMNIIPIIDGFLNNVHA